MIDSSTAPWAILLLRIGLGVLFLARGLLKLLVFKPAGAYGYFKSLGLPGSLACLTMAAELLGGSALILGILPRHVPLLLVPLILGTIFTVHGRSSAHFRLPCRRGFEPTTPCFVDAKVRNCN
jgi:putative oxidoreductase